MVTLHVLVRFVPSVLFLFPPTDCRTTVEATKVSGKVSLPTEPNPFWGNARQSGIELTERGFPPIQRLLYPRNTAVDLRPTHTTVDLRRPLNFRVTVVAENTFDIMEAVPPLTARTFQSVKRAPPTGWLVPLLIKTKRAFATVSMGQYVPSLAKIVMFGSFGHVRLDCIGTLRPTLAVCTLE